MNTDIDQTPPDGPLPPEASTADLPPVEPPSARFIVQLFLVPALIVSVIVVLVLFVNWLGSSSRDWQTLVINLDRDNAQRRGRAAHDLAQLLSADHQSDSDTPLSRNPQLATALCRLVDSRLGEVPSSEGQEAIVELTTLLRLLGLLDAHDVVLPVLNRTIAEGRDRSLRLTGLYAIARIGERAVEAGRPLTAADIVEQVVTVTGDDDLALRRMAVGALGMFDTDVARRQIKVLLGDPDPATRFNAATSLARQGSADGLAVFRRVLVDFGDRNELPTADKIKSRQEAEQVMLELVMLRNALKAIENLAHDDKLDAEQRIEMIELISPLAADSRPDRVRIDAKRVLQALNTTG